MEERSKPMAGNFVVFLLISFGLLLGYATLMQRYMPEKPPQEKKAELAERPKEEVPQPEDAAAEPQPEPEQPSQPDTPAVEQPEEEPAAIEAPVEPLQPALPRKWATLGSLDPASPYRMLATFDTRGATVTRIELNNPRYSDREDRSGYLGHLVIDSAATAGDTRGTGALVQVVGPGTPAAEAGLEPGDLIVAIGSQEINSAKELEAALRKTKPKREVVLTVLTSDGRQEKLTIKLKRRPLEVIRPESDDPLSFLMTMSQLDGAELDDQRTRDRSIAQLFAEMKLPARELAALDFADVNMAQGEIHVRATAADPKQWVALPAGSKKRLGAWLTVRGDHAGPLFGPLGTKSDRVSEAIVERIIAGVGEKEDRDEILFGELDGLDLRTGNWELVTADKSQVEFRRKLPGRGLEITKTYRLGSLPGKQANGDPANGDPAEAYHLVLDVSIRNGGEAVRQIAYQLDGPTGLPLEGVWYANKVARAWSAGLRDVVVRFDGMAPDMIGCPDIAEGDFSAWGKQAIDYMGVDSKYFACVMAPQGEDSAEPWFAESHPLRVGKVDPEIKKATNVSFRLVSERYELAPGHSLTHQFEVFAGPKKKDVLAPYELDELIYYGWFGWFAMPMAGILHFFYYVVGNYGVAILMLTVLVRGCMFPLSRKQALGARKMQELQPEIKKLQEKYKKDMEGRTKAQQELFRKHKYNPLSGCLVLFFQLPIFIALYRTLMVDIELRQAPLISSSIRWCSDLSAPDMLFRWNFMPEFVTSGVGILGLGPYFNLLPILTIFLFIAQQKMFMPPPTDDQTAMQQKIMKYMMVFMGLIFFKVASGLCIYFIASSLWGLAEKQFLPKAAPVGATSATPRSRAEAKAETQAARREAEAAAKRKKKGGPKK